MDKFNISIFFLIIVIASCVHKEKISNKADTNSQTTIGPQTISPNKSTTATLIIGGNDILPPGTWAENCRLAENETGDAVKVGAIRSLRSSYASTSSNNLFWIVSSYTDKACSILNIANRSTFECGISDNKKLGNFLCTQKKRESSRDLENWKNKPMVDHSGRPSSIKIYVSSAILKDSKIKFTSLSAESEEGDSIILTPLAN